MDIFISYSSKYRELCERLQLALEAEGHHCFVDRTELDPGHPWEPAPQLRPVVVAPHPDDARSSLLQGVEEGGRHPVTGVDHDVGGLDRLPDLDREVAGAHRKVGVGEQEQP